MGRTMAPARLNPPLNADSSLHISTFTSITNTCTAICVIRKEIMATKSQLLYLAHIDISNKNGQLFHKTNMLSTHI